MQRHGQSRVASALPARERPAPRVAATPQDGEATRLASGEPRLSGHIPHGAGSIAAMKQPWRSFRQSSAHAACPCSASTWKVAAAEAMALRRAVHAGPVLLSAVCRKPCFSRRTPPPSTHFVKSASRSSPMSRPSSFCAQLPAAGTTSIGSSSYPDARTPRTPGPCAGSSAARPTPWRGTPAKAHLRIHTRSPHAHDRSRRCRCIRSPAQECSP
jgi:hypothetical protein